MHTCYSPSRAWPFPCFVCAADRRQSPRGSLPSSSIPQHSPVHVLRRSTAGRTAFEQTQPQINLPFSPGVHSRVGEVDLLVFTEKRKGAYCKSTVFFWERIRHKKVIGHEKAVLSLTSSVRHQRPDDTDTTKQNSSPSTSVLICRLGIAS